MAGRPKQGIDYSGWSVDIFDSDTKIDKLLDSKGWSGFGIYFFLCQRAYKSNGYFFEWSYDDCATTARKMGGGINSGTVKETVSYCLQIDLFNKRLFDRWGVLTSRGIQRRFWTVLSERRSKIVYEEYWLLEDVECKGLVKVSLKSDMQPTNDNDEPANDDMQDIKESKVNKSIYINTAPPGKPFDNPELEKAFQFFLLCRRQNGKVINEGQIQLLREELCAAEDNDNGRIALAKKAAADGWTGFHSLKKTRKRAEPKKKTKFSNFNGREYDMNSLESKLLNSQKGGKV